VRASLADSIDKSCLPCRGGSSHCSTKAYNATISHMDDLSPSVQVMTMAPKTLNLLALPVGYTKTFKMTSSAHE
jgi:hypothetical protein